MIYTISHPLQDFDYAVMAKNIRAFAQELAGDMNYLPESVKTLREDVRNKVTFSFSGRAGEMNGNVRMDNGILYMLITSGQSLSKEEDEKKKQLRPYRNFFLRLHSSLCVTA